LSSLTLEDRLELADLPVRYARCADGPDLDGLARCLSPDAEYDASGIPGGAVHEGRDAFVAFVAAAHARVDAPQHFVTNVSIEEHDTYVTCHCYVFAPLLAENGGTFVGVRWEDHVVRTSEGWRIRRRRVHPVWRLAAR